MSDRYLEFVQSGFGQKLAGALGLPNPPALKRAEGGWQPRPLEGQAVVFAATRGRDTLTAAALRTVSEAGGEVFVPAGTAGIDGIRQAAQQAGIALRAATAEDDTRYDAIVFDASGAQSPDDLAELHASLAPFLPKLARSGRIVLLGRIPEKLSDASAAASQRALDGFNRSLAKEVGKRGVTAQLLFVEPGADERLAGPLRFFLSTHSAFITGQPLRVHTQVAGELPQQWSGLLQGKIALVTGAARGIGASIAQTLAREGAKVVCLDRPAEEQSLQQVATAIGGEVLMADVTDAAAPKQIADYLRQTHDGVDIVVHNAGVTRDRTLARMSREWWNMVLDINLAAILRINEVLLDGIVRKHGRIVCVSSIGGIAGNMGQTNYGATKAGVIGYVEALSRQLAERAIGVNAVAPGFIETQMTAAIPFTIREVGRRMNTLSQGGLPVDVAEAICFLASPAAVGVSGSTLRVCGQHLVGA
ncbi:MAG: 3-oxoacyl-ACP reductase [Nevskiales bacterium]